MDIFIFWRASVFVYDSQYTGQRKQLGNPQLFGALPIPYEAGATSIRGFLPGSASSATLVSLLYWRRRGRIDRTSPELPFSGWWVLGPYPSSSPPPLVPFPPEAASQHIKVGGGGRPFLELGYAAPEYAAKAVAVYDDAPSCEDTYSSTPPSSLRLSVGRSSSYQSRTCPGPTP